jgi:hypothetical protein
MTTETSQQAAEPTPSSTQRSDLWFIGVLGGLIGWFLVWPVVFISTFRPVTTGHHFTDLEIWLFGGGSFLWILSCCVVFSFLLFIVQLFLTWPSLVGLL